MVRLLSGPSSAVDTDSSPDSAAAAKRGGLLRRLPWRCLRRAAQVLFLLLFLWLFHKTDSTAADTLQQPVNLYFRLDPFAAAASMVGSRALLVSFWPALLVLVLTIVLGRFFCGWFCPLGTLLDLAHRILRPIAKRTNRLLRPRTRALRPARYVLLLLAVSASAFSLPLAGYVDPFALLVRGLTLWVDPAVKSVAGSAFDAAEHSAGPWSAAVRHAVPFVREHLVGVGDRAHLLGGAALAMLGVVFVLELVQRRFWCRYLCPLGAMLAVAARWTPLRRIPVKACPNCPATQCCDDTCRMDAFATEKVFKPDDCNLCMDCIADCPDARTAFRFSRRRTPVPPVDLSRRAALATIAVGLATPLVVKAARIGRPATVDPLLIRPPGVSDESAFLDRCVGCGLCMKVCPTNGLQPATLLAGIEGVFSPRLVPRIGYCQPDCTLCGQVCPTGAIPRLDIGSKSRVVLGKAVIDQARCLPWANNEPCIQCQEHCPTANNAIGYDEVEAVNSAGQPVVLKRPFVHWNRCNGCGICENKCPVDGESAIQVRRTESVPRGQGRGRGAGGGRGQGRRAGGQRRGAGRERGAE